MDRFVCFLAGGSLRCFLAGGSPRCFLSNGSLPHVLAWASRGRGLGPGLGPGLGIGLGPCLGLGPGRGLGLGLALDQGLGLGLARAGACDIGDVLLAFLVFSVARAVMLHSALSRCFRTSIFRWLYRNCKSSVLLCEK